MEVLLLPYPRVVLLNFPGDCELRGQRPAPEPGLWEEGQKDGRMNEGSRMTPV